MIAALFWSLAGYAALFAALAGLPPPVGPFSPAAPERTVTEVAIFIDDAPAPLKPAAFRSAPRQETERALPVPAAVKPLATAPAASESIAVKPDTLPAADAAAQEEAPSEGPGWTLAEKSGEAGVPDFKPSSGTLDIGEPEEFALTLLYSEIERGLRYPTQARRRGIQGTVALEIAVAASGALDRCEVAETSGSSLLDEAALKLLRGLFPFRQSLGGAFVTRIAIAYRLN